MPGRRFFWSQISTRVLCNADANMSSGASSRDILTANHEIIRFSAKHKEAGSLGAGFFGDHCHAHPRHLCHGSRKSASMNRNPCRSERRLRGRDGPKVDSLSSQSGPVAVRCVAELRSERWCWALDLGPGGTIGTGGLGPGGWPRGPPETRRASAAQHCQVAQRRCRGGLRTVHVRACTFESAKAEPLRQRSAKRRRHDLPLATPPGEP